MMQVYIVYMGSLPDGDPAYSPLAHHLSILHSVVEDRSYKRSFNGFAANLTDMEKDKLASMFVNREFADMKEVVSIFPSRTLQLQTTRSWDFMGLTEEISRNSSIVESDIIVGVFDTGMAFGLNLIALRTKVSVLLLRDGKVFVTVAKISLATSIKLIGARHYGYESARDEIGHGTHTASTVAGNAVKDVNFYGLANGTARGGVPAAKIAAHQVCIPCCQYHTLLAAFDDAIADGVNIITISLGQLDPIDLDEDAIAIGAFHAMKKGILTSQAAGNLSLGIASVSSVAPWILTVAASNTDRNFVDKIVLATWSMNHTNNNISTGAFAYGSGHINPVNAINPGLVYEASEEDYINLLCTIYDEGKVRQISGDKNSTCPTGSAKGSAKDHNYPSMGAKVEPTNPFSVNFHRRVKNVGLANSTYKAKIFLNSKVDIEVMPEVLSFKSLNEEKDFDVTVVGRGLPDQSQVSGSLVWSDGVHSVRSPIVRRYIDFYEFEVVV
ncbi:hypothetical protein DVH24_038578 [Malus domestica]|uniref:Subtilisin-like protease fibronectin type-III domain-containing protein n=1 Tax=Malus domestica TaxID=3750 RepID=A0A498KD63_MALDO|nr:hypothetical protein DVH24_038578 [Malus domestica]